MSLAKKCMMAIHSLRMLKINPNEEIIMKILMILFVLGMFASTGYAAETVLEKSEAQKNEVKRDASKAINRIDEETCTGTDTDCAKKKLEHRTEEAKDAIKDKSSEMKNKVD